jgi:hypothetical protein
VKQRRFVGVLLLVFVLSLISYSVIARALIARKNAHAESGTNWIDEYPFWIGRNRALFASSLLGPLPLFSTVNDHPPMNMPWLVKTTSLSDTEPGPFWLVDCDATFNSTFLAEYPLDG